MRSEKPVVIISGASGGIGLAAANLFYEKGYTVYGLNRTVRDSDTIHYISTDVSWPQSVESAVASIWAREQRIDVLVNNAGFGISGSIEFTRLEDAKKQLDVNFFGTFHCIKAVLPYMRGQKSGCILNVSSVAAVLSIPFQGFYSVSKAAINSLTLALANEVRACGIRVSALMPGDVKTGFTAVREKSMDGSDIYPAMARSIATMEHDEQNGMKPEYIAGLLFKIAGKKRPKPLYTSGFQYQLFVVIAKILPARLVNWLVGLLYAK
jgi:short-subunit dehydrogenase